MSTEILVVRRSSAFVKTTARQVDRRYNKFKHLLLASGGYRSAQSLGRACSQMQHHRHPERERGTSPYTVGSHKLTCVVHTALVRSLVVFATRDDGQRIVVTPILSQFQRAGLRESGTQVYDLCAQRTFCPLTVSSGLQTRWAHGPAALCSIRATLMRANLRAARRSYSCRRK